MEAGAEVDNSRAPPQDVPVRIWTELGGRGLRERIICGVTFGGADHVWRRWNYEYFQALQDIKEY